jgi:hypothetical protein
VSTNVVVLALLAASVSAQAALPPGRLEINRKAGAPGHSRAEFAIELRPGSQHAMSLQFDIACASGWRLAVEAGRGAALMGKTVATSDLSGGRKRVLVFSVDSLDLADGEVAVVTAVPDAEYPEPLWIEIDGILAVDQSAVPISLEKVRSDGGKGEALSAFKAAVAALEVGVPLYSTAACGLDVNGDGVVSVADLQRLAAMTAVDAPVRCDLTGDGVLTKADFDILLRAVLANGASGRGRTGGLQPEMR